MKKILLSCLAMAMSVSMFAITYTSQVTIALFDGSQVINLAVGESSDAEFAGGALVNGYYAPVQDLASSPIAVYAYYNNAEYENLVLDNLANVPMGIKTSSATSYTLYFANLEGTFKIYDKVAGQLIDCSTTYPFTIDASEVNSILNDRFVLQYAAPAVQGICFNYNKLQLTKYDGATVEVFADGAATATRTENVVGDATYEIDLSNEAAGKYKVVVTVPGATPEEYIIDVKPAVTVVP